MDSCKGLSSPDRLSLDSFFNLPSNDDEKEVVHQQEMQELHQDLVTLRDANILSQCLDGTQGRDFQLLSFLGDAVLHNQVTRTLLAKIGHDLQCDPANLSHLRAASGQYQTLAKVSQEGGFHMLGVASITPGAGAIKGIASTLLAVVGEIDMKIKDEAYAGDDMMPVMTKAMDRIIAAVLNRGMLLKGDTANSNAQRVMMCHRRLHSY